MEMSQEPQGQGSPSSTSSSPAPTPSPADTAPASTSQGSTDSGSQTATGAAAQTAEGFTPEAAAAPAYTPNYKFKAFDKEYELDEFVRGAIKDKETEDKLRSIYTKGHSFDVVMPKYKDLRDKYQEVDKSYKTLTENISMLDGHLNKGNFEEFFNTLNIPKEKIYKWVLDDLNYHELPPEQKAQHDQWKQAQQQNTFLEREHQRLQQQYEQANVKAKSVELKTVVAQPEVTTAAADYDQRPGNKPGSFINLVIERGQLAHWRSNGQIDLSAEDAVREALAIVGHSGGGQQADLTQGSQGGSPQAAAKPPVIPTIQGKGSSPARQVVKNLDDIKKRYNELSQ